MTFVNKTLAGLLVVQCALALVTWNLGGDGPAPSEKLLLSIPKDELTALELRTAPADEGEAERVRLERRGEDWVVASAGDYPAKTEKVEEVLEKLLDLRIGEPIATKPVNHPALKVGDREYDRKVDVVAGEYTHPLVFGSAKGTSVHVRRSGEDEVYWSRGLSVWNISERTSSYVDTEYVKVEDPAAVTIENPEGSFTLRRAGAGAWSLVDQAAGERLDTGAIESFVRSVATVHMTEPVGKDVKPEHGLEDGARVVLEDAEGEARGYTIGALDGDRYFVKSDASDFVVSVSKWSVEKILEKKREDLLAKQGGA